jgi:hypothetical protein
MQFCAINSTAGNRFCVQIVGGLQMLRHPWNGTLRFIFITRMVAGWVGLAGMIQWNPVRGCAVNATGGNMANACKPMIERLLSRIEKTEVCWIWTGQRDSNGYGKIGSGGRNGRNIPTHRALYELSIGTIPDGMELDHLCRNKICCRPDHLEPVTHAENMKRGGPANKTHCKNGHPFTPENTYRWRVTNRRRCRICNKLARRRYCHRKEHNQ